MSAPSDRHPPTPESSDVGGDELGRLRAIQRTLQRLATMGEPPEEVPGAFLEWGARPEDARALSAHPRERLGVYGGLVASTVLHAVHNQLAMTCARLSPDLLRSLVQGFLAFDPPRSPYLRDVPFEFAVWASGRWAEGAGVPGYLPDLARYELLLFAVGTTERGPRPESPEPLAADRAVWLDGSVHLARFRHAVHLLPEEEGDLSAPEIREVRLLCYRDGEDEIRKLELTPPAMEILQRLFGRAPLGRAVEEAARALGRSLDPALIEGISTVLADLSERGALLGPAPPGASFPDRAERSPFAEWLVEGGSRIGD